MKAPVKPRYVQLYRASSGGVAGNLMLFSPEFDASVPTNSRIEAYVAAMFKSIARSESYSAYSGWYSGERELTLATKEYVAVAAAGEAADVFPKGEPFATGTLEELRPLLDAYARML